MSFPFLDAHRSELNPAQLDAVSTTDGPVLILAGAGSGKTRVLTYRIAHLVYDHRVPLSAVLAMTFSNKAAREMHDRVKKLLNDESPLRFPWISTFHSVSARVLRMHGARLGYKPDFVIYDEADQLGLIKDALSELNISDKEVSPDAALRRISSWKEQGLTIVDAAGFANTWLDEKIVKIYEKYTANLKSAQAMDFDDLLLNFYLLLRNHDDIRLMLQNQWQYVLVDEFQDTNEIQYRILKNLLGPKKNLCVVGDDDQSIYGWRGAKIENILHFDKELAPCHVVKLEQNYRSTGNILKAAMSVISKNEMRHEKELWTKAAAGEKILLKSLTDDRDEARFIVDEMKRKISAGTPPAEIAVLYRVNSLSRGFEEECLRSRIKYRIVGGFRFYERKEIKDILGYLRIILNPADIMSFRRTINTPGRGIGKVSVDKAEVAALEAGVSIGDWICRPEASLGTAKAREGFEIYKSVMKWGREILDTDHSLADVFVEIIRRISYMEMLEADKDEAARDRVENIRELLSAVQDFEENWSLTAQERDGVDSSILREKVRAFLEHVSLMADIDGLDDDEDKVTFMSLHAAKGLEFDICFLAGMEDGLLPSSRSFDSYEKTEEERRLCYVGMTRAKKRLYLTRAERRRVFGSINFCLPSRFLKDLPDSVLEQTYEARDVEENSFYGRSWRSEKKANAKEWDSFDFDQRPSDESFDYAPKGSFTRGDRVRHPSFGEGIVQKSEYLGSEECLSIVFHGRGLKKVLSKFVHRA